MHSESESESAGSFKGKLNSIFPVNCAQSLTSRFAVTFREPRSEVTFP